MTAPALERPSRLMDPVWHAGRDLLRSGDNSGPVVAEKSAGIHSCLQIRAVDRGPSQGRGGAAPDLSRRNIGTAEGLIDKLTTKLSAVPIPERHDAETLLGKLDTRKPISYRIDAGLLTGSQSRACRLMSGLTLLGCLVSVLRHRPVVTLLAGEDHRDRQTCALTARWTFRLNSPLERRSRWHRVFRCLNCNPSPSSCVRRRPSLPGRLPVLPSSSGMCSLAWATLQPHWQ
ncbi:MAG: hypothetical protein JWM13_1256 [Arthrobacter sp.]|jgi:hypothetical protein|nr:hypothetical protein [Arthrobacter sp.]